MTLGEEGWIRHSHAAKLTSRIMAVFPAKVISHTKLQQYFYESYVADCKGVGLRRVFFVKHLFFGAISVQTHGKPMVKSLARVSVELKTYDVAHVHTHNPFI